MRQSPAQPCSPSAKVRTFNQIRVRWSLEAATPADNQMVKPEQRRTRESFSTWPPFADVEPRLHLRRCNFGSRFRTSGVVGNSKQIRSDQPTKMRQGWPLRSSDE